MAKINPKRLTWDPPLPESDVVGHRVYVAKEGETLDYNSLSALVDMPMLEIILPDQFPNFPLADANYNIGIAAVDDVGNESDMTLVSVPFDFAAPAAPTGVRVMDL